MKNIFHTLIYVAVFSSCSNFDDKEPIDELFSEDFKSLSSETTIEIIDLDSISNYSELIEQMGQLSCQGKPYGLRFRSNNTVYHVTGYTDCPSTNVIGCYFRRNLLYVRNDSLVIEDGKKKKPIQFLKTELNRIMSKTYSFQHNENQLKPALIHFYVEEQYSIETTKRALKEIVIQFEDINSQKGTDYFKYNIIFEGFDITSIPPPPPPPPPPAKPAAF